MNCIIFWEHFFITPNITFAASHFDQKQQRQQKNIKDENKTKENHIYSIYFSFIFILFYCVFFIWTPPTTKSPLQRSTHNSIGYICLQTKIQNHERDITFVCMCFLFVCLVIYLNLFNIVQCNQKSMVLYYP